MSDAPPLDSPHPHHAPSPQPVPATTTRLSGNWVIKQGVFLSVLLVFGVWGLADALYFYPRRGLEDASFKLRNYLVAASESGRLAPAELAIADPKRAYDELRPRAEELKRAATSSAQGTEYRRARFDSARFEWLEALARTWKLTTEPQVVISPGQLPKDFADAATRTVRYDPARGVGLVDSAGAGAPDELAPQRLLGELTQKWNTRDQVKPLSGYDMPLQWVFVAVGFGGGAWMILTMIRAASKKFRWEPATRTLVLPSGTRIAPGDVKEFDKRRWHKFFVTMHLKDGTTQTLDLLRHVPLEEWVLTMEKEAFPDSVRASSPEAEPVAATGNAGAENPNQ